MARRKTVLEGPDPVDIYVGQRVKLARQLVGLSQEKLGEICSVSFQQVQKYEKGANRISASMLVLIAKALNRPVGFFFEGIEAPIDNARPDPLKSTDVLELGNYFLLLAGDKRSVVMNLVKAMARPNAVIAPEAQAAA